MATNSDDNLKRLRDSVAELSILNEIAVSIGGSLSLEEITSNIIGKCVRHLQAEQGAVFLLAPDSDDGSKFQTFVRRQTDPDGVPIRLSMNLAGWMVKNKRPLVVEADDTSSPLARLNLAGMGIRSLVAAPLLTRRKLSGLIVLFNRKGARGFEKQHSRFLGIAGTQCAQVIENARLHQEEQRLQTIERELALAKSIQRDLLPDPRRLHDPAAVFGSSSPAREVGGDYFDLVSLGPDRQFIALGDVSGKGVPAALLMSNALAAQRTHLSGVEDISLDSLAAGVNRMLYQHTDSSQYITALMGLVDREQRVFEYVNAGHHAPILIADGGARQDDHVGELVLGFMPDVPYRVRRLPLPEGSSILIYSDGVTEALSESGEEYGNDRLLRLLAETGPQPADALCRTVAESVAAHRGSAVQSDDITIVAATLQPTPRR